MRWLLFLTLLISGSRAEGWEVSNYPNPTAGQFQECGMRTTANICDPDGMLSEQARYRLDHDLQQLESRTRQDHGRNFCEKKGVTAAMAVARHVKGASTEAVTAMANDMLQKWTLDEQCQKSVVIVVSIEDRKFWVARDDKVPVYGEEFTQLFVKQRTLFQEQNYQKALSNILQGTWELALSKQGPRVKPVNPNESGKTNKGESKGEEGGKSSGGKSSSEGVSKWFWLAVVIFVVVPIILCCLCLCFCKSLKDSCCGGESSGGGGGGGGGPHRMEGGGGGIPHTAGGYHSRGDYHPAPTVPPPSPPAHNDNNDSKDDEGNGGLYPSVAVKDEGGGGSW